MRSKDGKTRTDAWEAPLAEEARWDLFDRARNSSCGAVMDHAAEVYGLPRCSRAAFYNFLNRMRSKQFERKMQQVRIARAEVGKLAGEVAGPGELMEAYMSMAQDLAVVGDADTAVKYTGMALDIAAGQTKKKELELKAERLKLQREIKARETAAEKRANELDALCKSLKAELENAGKSKAVDLSAVMSEVNKILGRRAKS